MRNLAKTGLAALVLVSLTACGHDSGSTASAADFECGDAPEVELVKAGSEPLEELKLSPKKGDSVRLDTTMDMSMSITADGEALPSGSVPPMTLGMAATVERVTDDQIEMSFEYDKVDVEGGDPSVESTLQTLVGTSGTITTDANGVFLDGDIEAAPGMDSTMKTMLDQLEQQFANLTVPLPTEAVGRDAEWKVTTPIEVNGVEACNSYTYRLSELDGSEYALDVDIAQEMTSGTVEQNGVETKIVSGSTTGDGSTHGDLTMPLAVTGTTDVHSSTSMEIDQGGDTQDVETDMDLSLKVNERR